MDMVTEQTGKKNGHVVPPLEAAAMVFSVLVADIDESPTNPRKTFTGIDDLATDIKLRGVLSPALARPSPHTRGRMELVFGARRFRATKEARLTHFPLMVRELTDAEVLEIQIVVSVSELRHMHLIAPNLEREGRWIVTPLGVEVLEHEKGRR